MEMEAGAAAPPRTVVVGGGIHSVSLAYFLAKQGADVTVVERSRIAAAASGKAGGFLAREWGDSKTEQLHHRGFDMHAELAEELGFETYRRLTTLQVAPGFRPGKRRPNPASWLDGNAGASVMDTGTAQVTPAEYCEKVWAAAEAAGAKLVVGRAAGVERDEASGAVTGVRVEGEEALVTGDAYVLAAGPWTGPLAEEWFGMRLPMTGIKSTSVILGDVDAMRKEPFAAFCGRDAWGCHLELYPRPDGSLYICGCGGSDEVDNDRMREGGDCYDPDSIAADPARVAAARQSLADMSSIGRLDVPAVEQACMRPSTPDGLPVMGRVPGAPNAFVTAGHNCWGILWAPISGKAMSELILTGESSLNLSRFEPGRFGTLAVGEKRPREEMTSPSGSSAENPKRRE
uniref:FAD dependent oxidoreductase domain-containing protein n=2 Tax=Phaeomonas parva TaxID=124430 RepID=A0A7S1U924_9STRA